MGTASIPASLGLADAMAPGRPTHIVVFRRPRTANVSTLSKAIGQGGKPVAVAGRPGLLESAATASVPMRYYERFGVAAVSLDEMQRRELAMHSDVEGVYANLMRSIPRPVSVPTAPTAAVPILAASAPVVPRAAGTVAEACGVGARASALSVARLVALRQAHKPLK